MASSFSLTVKAFRFLLWFSILISVNLIAEWTFSRQQGVPDKFHSYTLYDRVRSNRRPVIRVADWMNIQLGRQGGHIKLENSVSFKYLQINYG